MSFFTITEFNRLTKISFDARMKKVAKSLPSKSQVNNALDIADYFIGKRYLHDNGSWNFLIFKRLFKSYRQQQNLAWKSVGLPKESIKPPTTSDNSLAPKLTFIHNLKIAVEFKGSSWKKTKQILLLEMWYKLFVYELDK